MQDPLTTDSETALEQARAEAGREFMRAYYDGRASTMLTTHWQGVNTQKLPFDLWMLQEIVFETQPDLVIETGVHDGGGALFFASLMDLMGRGEVIGVDVDLSRVHRAAQAHPRITLIEGSSVDDAVVEQLSAAAEGRRVMLDLDSDHAADHVLEELRRLSGLVSPGCYMVVEDGIVATVDPEFGPGPLDAMATWFESGPPFEVDPSRERLLATCNPGGFLKRTGETEDVPAAQSPAPPDSADGELRLAYEAERRESAALRDSVVRSSRSVQALRNEVERLLARVADLEGGQLKSQQDAAAAWQHTNEVKNELRQRENEARHAKLRLKRLQSSLPFRALNRLRGLPPFKQLLRRRERQYWQEAEQRDSEE